LVNTAEALAKVTAEREEADRRMAATAAAREKAS
jgi:hypothetical protein